MSMFERLFGEPQPPPKAPEPEPLALVTDLLDRIGEARLTVRSPRMKVLLTKIARGGLPYLTRNAPNGVPAEKDLMQFQDNLETLLRVLAQYALIQDTPEQPERLKRMDDGLRAVSGFAAKVLNAHVPGGQSSMTAFAVDTKILEAQRYTA